MSKWTEGEAGAELGETIGEIFFGLPSTRTQLRNAGFEETLHYGLIPGVKRRQMSAPEGFGPWASGYSFPDAGGGDEGFWSGRPDFTSKGYYSAYGKAMGFRNRRRINPLNYRAATRAIRRIGMVHHQLVRIERMLPTHRTSKKHFHFKRRRRH